jgi:L-fucono-1,5-lactonase
LSIDAHQHFWQLGRPECHWPTSVLPPIHRDFGPAELAPLAAAAGVTGTVLVQSQPDDRDTDFLLELAAATPLVRAVVAWVELARPTAPARIASLARHPKMRGIRPMLQDLADERWLLRPALSSAIEALLLHGLSFDALIRPRHLPHLLEFAARYPALPIIIDHAAKPDLVHGALDPWRADLARLAEHPNVSCKLSGLLTEAAPDWKPEDLRPCVDVLCQYFGVERLMWGSDWPVVNLASSYQHWYRLAQSLIGVHDGAIAAVFDRTARRIYRL